MTPRDRRRRLTETALVVALVVLLVGCNPVEGPETAAMRQAKPCADGQIVDLGMPNAHDRWATFEVEKGPVWVGVDGWDPGMLDPSPYRATIKVGPSDRPPEPDDNGNVPSETARTAVVDGQWSPLDIPEGNYWLLASSIADSISLQACEDARIGTVRPAS